MASELRRLRPETPLVLMSASGHPDAAVEAMQAGAFDYISKPVEPEAALFRVERALERCAVEEENRRLRRAMAETGAFRGLVGESPAMRDIFALIRKIAHGRSSVLITGESGTGKEVVARTIHYHGPRAGRPFVPVRCAAIPEELLESELFGCVRGAFSDAHTSKRGLFEKANGGTLFLDEVGDVGPSLQSQLLRVLQDGEIRPVGGTRSVKVDVRIIAATNKKLEVEMEAGRFREDLYFRINVIPIHIPPLRERPEDIPPLVKAFVRRHSDGRGRSVSPAAMARLEAAPWKGNVRELENAIERALALCDSREIGGGDLPLEPLGASAAQGLAAGLLENAVHRRLTLRELETLYISEIMKCTGGNKVQAARILGVDRKTLYRRAERSARTVPGRRADR
jgi:DNA-binding NtrC family response regulator